MEEATLTARGEAVVPGTPDEGIWAIAVSILDTTPDAALAEVGARTSQGCWTSSASPRRSARPRA